MFLLKDSAVSMQYLIRNNEIPCIRTSENHYNVMKACWDRGKVKKHVQNHSKPVDSSKSMGLNAGISL